MARVNQRPSETPVRSSNLPTAPPSIAPSSPDPSSDKENHSTAAPRDKGKGRMQSTTSDSHSAKRRRTQSRPTASVADHLESDDESRFYDPTQDQHERQEVKKKSRALEREFNGAYFCFLYSDAIRSNML
jgi:hypothetical protein